MEKPNITKLRHVTIRELAPANRLAQLSDMTIGSGGVSFFTSAVSNICDLKSSKSGHLIQAIFFKGSSSEITLLAELHETEKAAENGHRTICSGLFIEGNLEEATREKASTFLRDSGTLAKEKPHYTTSERALFIDSGSFAYIAKDHNQFLRVTLIAMLAEAYTKALEAAIVRLSESARASNDASSLELYKEMLYFNAGFYQKLPVQLDRHELSKVWDGFFADYRIGDLHSELDAKLSALAQWLQQSAEQKRQQENDHEARERARRFASEDRRSRRMNRLIGISSTALAFISIVLAFLALPESTQGAFWQGASRMWALATKSLFG